MNSRWLIKDPSGQLIGPLSEKEILEKIQSQGWTGQYQIREYPSGEWKDLSSASFCKTREGTLSKDYSKTFKRSSKGSSFKSVRVKRQYKNSQVIELENVQEVFLKTLWRKLIFPIGFLSLIGAGAWIFLSKKDWNQSKKSPIENSIQFIIPRLDQNSLPKQEIIKKIRQGLAFYSNDQSSFYLKSQNEFVQAIEGAPRNKVPMAYLCLVYFELWPFSSKSGQHKKAISWISDRVNRVDQGGIYSSFCRVVEHFTNDEFEKAYSLIKTSTVESSQNEYAKSLTPFFDYLKSIVQIKMLKDQLAITNLQNVQALLPTWIQPDMRIADILKKNKEFSKALKFYSAALKKNPNHKGALLSKGILEYQYLKKSDLSETNIQRALSSKDEVLLSRLAEAYFVLTQIALKRNDPEQALEYGYKSYELDPSNKSLKDLITQLSKKTNIKKNIVIKSQQLIEKGDQLEREGQSIEARNYYKSAFEVDQGKNAIAAQKMGKSLWKFGFLSEAIEWLKKSIVADPEYIDSYVLLSDYYSQVYDFKNAMDILRIARQKSPNSVDIFKGYSLMQFRKKDFESAQSYAQKALELYESDVDSYILLSKIHLLFNDIDEGFKAASQAIEIDGNRRDAQIQYAKALGAQYEVDTAFNYLEKFISKSDKGSTNRIDYVLGLVEFLIENDQDAQAKETIQDELGDLEKKPYKYHLLLGQIYFKDSDTFEQAQEQFILSSTLNPSNPEPLFYLGQLFFKTAQYKDSRKYFEKILRSYPRYPEIHYYIARTLYLEGGKENISKAIKSAITETKLNPELSSPFKLLGEIYYDLKKYTLCAQSFQKALALTPEDSEIYIQTAVCYRKAGDIDLALTVLKSIEGDDLKNPNPKIFKELGILHEIKRNYEEATDAFGFYLKLLPHAKDRKKIERRIKNYDNYRQLKKG